MENGLTRYAIHTFLLCIGLGLIIGGLIIWTAGAVAIGFIVTGINIQQWFWWKNRQHTG